MRWFYKLPLRLRSLLRKQQADHELSAELQFHLQRQIEQYEAQGMAQQEARYAALRELGGLEQIKEECREMREVSVIENLLQDLRFALRTLVKNPGFSFVVVTTLALGIGVNTAIFTLVNAMLLQPLPYADPTRLVNVGETGPKPMGGVLGFQERVRSMEIAAYSSFGLNLSGDGNALRLSGSATSSNLFSLLGAHAALGRIFQPGDQQPGKDRLAILSYSLWQTRFGGDPNILGRSITIDDVSRQVIGVMPESFDFPSSSTQIWIPATLDRQNLWLSFDLYMIGRLKPGVSLEQARAEFKAAAPQVVKTFPWQMGENYAPLMNISGMQKDSVADVRTTLLLLLGAVTLILLVACINVANLLLARAAGRQREMAVRAALGASRQRIIRQLLTESVFLSLLGGVAGVVLAFLSLYLLKAVLPQGTPRLAQIRMDGYVLTFAAALSFLTGLLFGLAPAVNASRPELDQTLRSASQSAGGSRGRSRLSSTLVVGEVALAVILVSGAGLLIKSLYALTTERTGLQTAHLLTAHITPTSSFCQSNDNCKDFYSRVLDEVRSLPGVTNAALSDGIPLYSSDRTVVAAENSTQFTPQNPHSIWEFTVESDYLDTMGIKLLLGRTFNRQDRSGAPLVVLVDKKLADLFWPGQDPLGKRIKLSWTPDWRTVIGVVETVSSYKVAPDWYAKTIVGQVYFPADQGLRGHPQVMDLLVRSEGDLRILAREIPGVVSRVNASVPVTKIRSMDEVIHVTTEEPRSTMWLFTAFAALALSLGLIGIYSVMSCSVAQRRREIGIRMAMGADRRVVLKMILGQGSKLALAGLVAGVAGALLLTRFMASLLYGTRPGDPATLVAVAVLVGVAAVLASYLPARRATAIDPTVALKYE
jgi:putative ABC transport system permease protein